MSVYKTDRYQHLLASVRASPEDDLPRLVLADWLDEQTATASKCGLCRGKGKRRVADGPFGYDLSTIECGACDGSGWAASPTADYAAFIRVGVDLHRRYPKHATAPMISAEHWHAGQDGCPACALQRQECRLFDRVTPLLKEWLPGTNIMRMRWTDGRHDPHLSTTLPGGLASLHYRRGFVDRISAPLAVLHGGECRTCPNREGVGQARREIGLPPLPDCRQCHGTGRTEGVLPALVRREPVMRVEVTDREPYWNGYGHCWYNIDRERRRSETHLAELPIALYGWLECMIHGNTRWSAYPTAEAARDALSRALLRWAMSDTPAEVSV